ncbi:hypothetical protein ABZ570_03455 [Micromonospora sp. NPDC007271]|uniref:hypothetical protein n=1 Tax=Micromonospora sp. NPDC007271 TaxID=3154587 RepID=UPI00340ACAD3
MDDVSSLRSSATAFAEQHAMTVVPAVPLHDLGPEVQLDAEAIDLPRFLALAQGMGAPALYLEVDPFDADPEEVADPPAHLPRAAVRDRDRVCRRRRRALLGAHRVLVRRVGGAARGRKSRC